MASKDFAILDMQDEDQEINLQFQDFGQTPTQSLSNVKDKGFNFTDYSESPDEEQDQEEKLLGSEPTSEMKTSFWTFEFYQQFFNVDSKQVGDRILWSMVPKPGVNYLQSYIRPNPDLYGPFWISITLMFTTAITGNLSSYLQTAASQHYIWRYDFHKVTFAASCIFAYASLVPVAVWGVLVWRGMRANLSILELLCIYGYSLAIFVPVSILWVIPQPWLQWCLAIVAPVLSGTVLVRTIWPALEHDTRRAAIIIATVVLLLHATLALGFMLYFFRVPDSGSAHGHLSGSAAVNVENVQNASLVEATKQNSTSVDIKSVKKDAGETEAKSSKENDKEKRSEVVSREEPEDVSQVAGQELDTQDNSNKKKGVVSKGKDSDHSKADGNSPDVSDESSARQTSDALPHPKDGKQDRAASSATTGKQV